MNSAHSKPLPSPFPTDAVRGHDSAGPGAFPEEGRLARSVRGATVAVALAALAACGTTSSSGPGADYSSNSSVSTSGGNVSSPAAERVVDGVVELALTDQLLPDFDAARARKLGFEEREVLDIDARFDRSRLVEATQSTSLFASQRLIDLRLNTKPTRELGDALRELLPRLDDGTRVLVSSAHLERATTSTAWFEALAKQMLWVETPRIDAGALGKWVTERLAAQKQQATPAVLALITERTEGNLLAAHQAIQRLGLLLPPGELPAEAVAEIVLDSARFELFGLVDAALAADPARAVRMARSRTAPRP